MKTEPLNIYFIRHGETEWSLSGQYTGRTDIPLTAHGEDAAREVGRRLRGIPFTHVLTSPLQRARQTCVLAGLEPISEIVPDLTEWDNGDDEGHTSAEVSESRPDWNLFRDGSPNGETPAQISNRADRLITQLRTLDGNIALFSHSHFGRVLAARWIGLPVAQAQRFLLNTASVSVLCYEHHSTDQPAIALWNSAASDETHWLPATDADSRYVTGSATDSARPDAATSLSAELVEQKEHYLRLAADFENFKKRTRRDSGLAAMAEKEAFICDVLPVLDNLERALAAEHSLASAPLYQGVAITLQQIGQLLQRHGIKATEDVGLTFDSHCHEAVCARSDPHQPDQIVLEVIRCGYRCGERVLRPAQVVVNVLDAVPGARHVS